MREGRQSLGQFMAMKTLPISQPSFLSQPCNMPPLLVTLANASRLLGVGRLQVKKLIADGQLQLVEIDGFERVVMASIAAYVDRLMA